MLQIAAKPKGSAAALRGRRKKRRKKTLKR